MSQSLTESIVEEAALTWLQDFGYTVMHDPAAERVLEAGT